jgi:hypothetical protein
MVNLPFVVQPRRQPIVERVGSEESGIIEIERRGYLTSGEKSFVQQVQQTDGGTTELVTLSRRVARRHGLSMDKAYEIVLAIISNDLSSEPELSAKVEEEFAQELTGAVQGLTATQAREELIMAACLLKYRVNSDFEIDSIVRIHPDIISGLAALYRDEERKSIEAFLEDKEDQPVPSVEETEKKSGKTPKFRSTNITTD